jgi:hypothetical protein
MIYALLAAAAALLLWPSGSTPRRAPMTYAPPATTLEPIKPARPTYTHAIHALATVRSRLAATDQLGDAERAAIDAVTLALVAGSDAE